MNAKTIIMFVLLGVIAVLSIICWSAFRRIKRYNDRIRTGDKQFRELEYQNKLLSGCLRSCYEGLGEVAGNLKGSTGKLSELVDRLRRAAEKVEELEDYLANYIGNNTN